MSFKRIGFIAAIFTAFAAGSKAGIEYAKLHYVSKDRKFIEGEVVKSKDNKDQGGE